jgi:hypothetical protein
MSDLGLGLNSGDPHYRAFVGPPEDYDLISGQAFSLLISLGLRGHHSLTDIGCGSLRIGRLLIPYLNEGRYTGIEPHEWLVEQGVLKEVGSDLVRMRRPRFLFQDNARGVARNSQDWILAQSIFSHCGITLLRRWLKQCGNIMARDGQLLATFVLGATDVAHGSWHYPGCTNYTWETIERECERFGLVAVRVDWPHPRQVWFRAWRKQ